MAIEEHAIEGILVVGMVVDFPDAVVAGIHRGKCTEEGVRCPTVREEIACTDRGCSSSASSEFHADSTWGNSRGLQCGDRVYHALRSVPHGQGGGNRNTADEPDEGTQALVSAKEE